MSGATENVDGTKKKWKHGRAVDLKTRQLRFASVSAIEKADPGRNPTSGCLRKYFYQYILGLKEDETDSPSLIRGNKGHADLAHFLTTGDRSRLSSLALSGIHQLPDPGPDLLVELPIIPDTWDGLQHATLHASGIPILGAIDLAHARRENPGVTDIMYAVDEPGVLKLIDHKFPSTLDNAKGPHDLIHTTQMSGYGQWAFNTVPGLERVRLAHNVVPERGAARLVMSPIYERRQIEQAWKQSEVVAVSMRDAVKETNPDLVDANTQACRAFHRDCPALKVCRAAKHDSLSDVFGQTGASRIGERLTQIRQRPQPPGEQPTMTTTPSPINLIAQLAAKSAASAAQGPAPIALVPPPSAPITTAPSQADVQAEIARLTAQEAAASAPIQAPAKPVTEALAAIEALGMGRPQIAKALGNAYCAENGHAALPKTAAIAGSGVLGQYTLTDVSQLGQAYESARGMVAKAAADAQIAQLNQAAIAAQQQVVAQIAAATPTPVIAVVPPVAPSPAPIPQTVASILPADAPQSIPALATSGPDGDKKKSGKKAGKKAAADAEKPPENAIANAFGGAAPAPAQVPLDVLKSSTATTEQKMEAAGLLANAESGKPVQAPSAPGINLYVDCIPDGVQTTSLWPTVYELMRVCTEEAAKEAKPGEAPAPDFRCADPNGKFGYGRSEGILAAVIRAAHAQGTIAPANYTFDSSFGMVGRVVVETMRDLVLRAGGTFVRGVR